MHLEYTAGFVVTHNSVIHLKIVPTDSLMAEVFSGVLAITQLSSI